MCVCMYVFEYVYMCVSMCLSECVCVYVRARVCVVTTLQLKLGVEVADQFVTLRFL